MSRTLRASLLCGLLAACGRSGAAVLAAPPAPAPSAPIAFPVDPARVLRGYSWDGASEVPWVGGRPPESLAFGELGRTPSTLLYLTLNHDLAEEVAAQAVPWSVEAREATPEVGRFSGALALQADSLLRFAIPPALREQRAWTVEFWLKPGRTGGGALLALPGLLVVRTDPDDRIEAEVPLAGGEGEQVIVKSSVSLLAREWNHVGIVVDLQDLGQLRVVVNGQPARFRLDAARVGGRAEELLIGDCGWRLPALPAVIDELRVQGRAANTAELEEHWLSVPRPLERLRLRFEDGAEELEVWTDTHTEPRIDSEAGFALGDLAHAVPTADGLGWAAGHWRRVEAADPPLARTTHPAVAIGDHRLLVFSGEVRDTHVGSMVNSADTWVFDMRAETWTRLAPPVAPRGRCHQAAAYSPDHDLVLLAGGWVNETDPGEILGDTWVFHGSAGRWEERHPGGDPQGDISDCGVVYHAGARVFLIFAGAWVRSYDPAADRWERLPPATVVDEDGLPAAYEPLSVTAGYDPGSEQVVLFGGKTGVREQFLDSCALYDLAGNRFTVLGSQPRPAPRVRPGFGWDSRRERFVLFGGVRDQNSVRMRDLWTFDPRTRSWTGHASSGTPSNRGGYYGMGYDPELDRFFLLQGRHSAHRFLEDSWSLELDESAEGRARYLFDRAAFPAETAWFADVATPAGSSVTVRFRSGEDGRTFGAWVEACPDTGRFVEVDVHLRPGTDGSSPLVRAMGFRAPS